MDNEEIDLDMNESEVEFNLNENEESKPFESLEARKARLERQLSQTNRKLGVDDSKKINRTAESTPRYNILEDEVADLILGGYTKDETKFILSNGGRKALENKDSYVAIAINAKREQKRVEDAVGETSNSSGLSLGGKTYTEEQMRNMSVEDLEKILPHA